MKNRNINIYAFLGRNTHLKHLSSPGSFLPFSSWTLSIFSFMQSLPRSFYVSPVLFSIYFITCVIWELNVPFFLMFIWLTDHSVCFICMSWLSCCFLFFWLIYIMFRLSLDVIYNDFVGSRLITLVEQWRITLKSIFVK